MCLCWLRKPVLLETNKIQCGCQGASSKRANSNFPCRAWKILIGWFNSVAEFGRIWQIAEIAPVLTQFFVGGRRFAGGHRVGFRPDLRSLGLKSLINARISPGSRPMSLHPPQSIYLKWTMTYSCRARDKCYIFIYYLAENPTTQVFN